MKRYFLLSLFGLLQLSSFNLFSQADCEFLIWSDEFEYTGLPDSTKWGYDVGDGCSIDLCNWGNNEMQYYTYRDTDNARVENGSLIIEAKKEQMGGKEYTSARLTTWQLFEMTYGRIDISAKLPGGGGTWSALWLLGDSEYYGSWPKNGEIDLMEYLGRRPDTISGTIHCPTNYGGNGDVNTYVVPTAETEFHEYSVEWTPDSIIFLVDNVVYHTYLNLHEGSDQWPFDKPFHLIFNVAIGGNLGGPVNENLFDNPVIMEVEYVHVYQQPRFSVISGKTVIAKGEANLNYSTPIPANNYIWEVPAGATITSGQGTSEINVDWGCDPDTIGLTLQTGCDTVTITQGIQVSQAKLSGKELVQPKEGDLEYSVPIMNNGTYLWTLPEGVTAVGSVDSNRLALIWGCSDGNIKVDFSNICETGSLEIPVTVLTPKISGPATVIKNATDIIYSVDSILNSIYTWTVPSGVVITGGQHTTSINTDWESTGGTVRVDVENSCGVSSDEIAVNVSTDFIICNFEATNLDFNVFGETVYEPVENPFKEGINTSDNVGKTYKGENAVSWAGIYADLGYELNFDDSHSIKMDIYAVKQGIVKCKIEDHTSGANPVDIDQEVSVLNEWTTLTFDFEGLLSDTYERIALFFDFGSTDPDIYYFDNIVLAGAEEQPEDLSSVGEKSKMLIYPNPSEEYLYFKLPENEIASKVVITDMTGKLVLAGTAIRENQRLSIKSLVPGSYSVSVITGKGIYNATFIKP